MPAKANKAQQVQFIDYYNALKKRLAGKAPIYFNDSTHPHHQTRLAYGWLFKGERTFIAQTACQHHVNYMGALNLEGHKVVYREVDKVNAQSINEFLKKLRKNHPPDIKIHIIWDNAGYHRSRDVRKMADELNVQLHYLPPYSPNLNPIERLWKIMHEQVSYNHYYPDFKSFRDTLRHFFRHIVKKKILLRKRLNDNFHLFDTTHLAF